MATAVQPVLLPHPPAPAMNAAERAEKAVLANAQTRQPLARAVIIVAISVCTATFLAGYNSGAQRKHKTHARLTCTTARTHDGAPRTHYALARTLSGVISGVNLLLDPEFYYNNELVRGGSWARACASQPVRARDVRSGPGGARLTHDNARAGPV